MRHVVVGQYIKKLGFVVGLVSLAYSGACFGMFDEDQPVDHPLPTQKKFQFQPLPGGKRPPLKGQFDGHSSTQNHQEPRETKDGYLIPLKLNDASSPKEIMEYEYFIPGVSVRTQDASPHYRDKQHAEGRRFFEGVSPLHSPAKAN